MIFIFTSLTAFVVMLLGMPGLIISLKKLKFGQTIYTLGPQAHLSKQGTPNMGGLLIAASTLAASLGFALYEGIAAHLLPLILVSLGTMAIGFSDDYIKDVRKNHEGLKPMQKIFGQVVAGLAISIFCYISIGSSIRLPFTKNVLDLGVFYVPLMTVLVIFMTNSANLQDGVDGILSSVSILGATAFGLIALMLTDARMIALHRSMAFPSFALAGACAGFLLFNHYPAKIMMGDTGSMFIGGLLVGIAMLLRLQLWLIPICFTMIMSSLSVIIQRVYFKLTHGKRIFKMSPIHHHFELSGMSENQIVGMYAVTTLALSVLAVLAALPLLANGK